LAINCCDSYDFIQSKQRPAIFDISFYAPAIRSKVFIVFYFSVASIYVEKNRKYV